PGPWADATNVTPAIAAAGVELATPATQPSTAAPTTREVAPASADAKIIVATEPSELIVTTGDPQFTPVPGAAGTELQYASNTTSDLFLDRTEGRYYVL